MDCMKSRCVLVGAVLMISAFQANAVEQISAPGVKMADGEFSAQCYSGMTPNSGDDTLCLQQKTIREPAGREVPVNTGVSPHISNAILHSSASCDVATVRRAGKVVEVYWTNGPGNTRVTTDEVDHYADLNIVVKTTGYRRGDCIEARIHTHDGEDVALGTKEIVLRGKVNEHGIAFFNAPMNDFTLILR